MTIKDSLDSEGVISTGGTTGRAFFIPQNDSTVVARLRSAGAILLGKTNTPELTLAGETDNLIYGPTNNPYDLSASPGGSSGGCPEQGGEQRRDRPAGYGCPPLPQFLTLKIFDIFRPEIYGDF